MPIPQSITMPDWLRSPTLALVFSWPVEYRLLPEAVCSAGYLVVVDEGVVCAPSTVFQADVVVDV